MSTVRPTEAGAAAPQAVSSTQAHLASLAAHRAGTWHERLGRCAVTLADVRSARDRIVGICNDTPLVRVPALAARCGADVRLKLESLQITGSFKIRGACNKVLSLSDEKRRRGIVAASAGNHSQGVAFIAHRFGIPTTIVMPVTSPFMKIERTKEFGADVVLAGQKFDEAKIEALRLAEERGLEFVHPFEDIDVIAGQGTIGLEMVHADPELECVLVPIGGGGLLAGIAVAIKSVNPTIEVIGVQAANFNPMAQLFHGTPPDQVELPGDVTIADGIAVRVPGDITRDIIFSLVDDIVSVTEEQLESAVQMLAEYGKLVSEGAGAASLAAVLAAPHRFRGKRVGVLLCGASVDQRTLAQVLMRGLVRSNRLIRLRVRMMDTPGMLAKICALVGDGNIIELVHQRLFSSVNVRETQADFSIETRSPAHSDEIVARLEANGFRCERLSPDPLPASLSHTVPPLSTPARTAAPLPVGVPAPAPAPAGTAATAPVSRL